MVTELKQENVRCRRLKSEIIQVKEETKYKAEGKENELEFRVIFYHNPEKFL